MGLIGLEPMTLRLSSACSNQLSYKPWNRVLTLFCFTVLFFLRSQRTGEKKDMPRKA